MTSTSKAWGGVYRSRDRWTEERPLHRNDHTNFSLSGFDINVTKQKTMFYVFNLLVQSKVLNRPTVLYNPKMIIKYYVFEHLVTFKVK